VYVCLPVCAKKFVSGYRNFRMLQLASDREPPLASTVRAIFLQNLGRGVIFESYISKTTMISENKEFFEL